MLSDEITVNGLIKVPYPFLSDFNKKIDELKGRDRCKLFPDYILPHIDSFDNAILPFVYSYRYEEGFDFFLVEQFEKLLYQIDFLLATLMVSIDDKFCSYYEYVSDGSAIYKTFNNVIEKESSVLIPTSKKINKRN